MFHHWFSKWEKEINKISSEKEMEISTQTSTASIKKHVKKTALEVIKIKIILMIVFLTQVHRKWDYKKTYRSLSKTIYNFAIIIYWIVKGSNNKYFLLVNFSVPQNIFEEVSRCPDCDVRLIPSDKIWIIEWELNCDVI